MPPTPLPGQRVAGAPRAPRPSSGDPQIANPHRCTLTERLRSDEPSLAVELRPPRSGLSHDASIESWIDMQRAARGLARRGVTLFLTDNAVGEAEEENLHHLTANLAQDVELSGLVPILTCKHALEYCLMYAARAASAGLEALTVLGGDRFAGPPRCVEHAWELRRQVRSQVPALALGGWANPHRDPAAQAEYLCREEFSAEYYLTQVVSHHHLGRVERFLEATARRAVPLPALFGVFYYRSARPRSLERLGRYFPVPAAELTREFEAGRSADDICLQTLRALRALGIRHFYLSNLDPVEAVNVVTRLQAEL